MSANPLARLRSTPLTFGSLMEGRTNNFDALRFVLAVMVIVSHSYPLTGHDFQEFVGVLTHGQQTAGGLAVSGFFAISGLLISASWERTRGLGDFLRKRILRIYPGWTVAWLVSMFIVGPLAVANPSTFLHATLAPLNLVKGIFKIVILSQPDVREAFLTVPFKKFLNGSMWTIRYEFICYVVVALLGLMGLLRRRWAVLFLVALCYIGFVLRLKGVFLADKSDLPGTTNIREVPRLLTCFMMGAGYYVWRDKVPFSPILCVASVLVLVGASVCGVLNYFIPLCGIYVLFYLAYTPALRLHNFGKWGDFSYGVYLYAFPVQQLLVQRFGPQITPGGLSFAAFGLTLLLAISSWYGVERPFLRLKARSAKRETGFASEGFRSPAVDDTPKAV